MTAFQKRPLPLMSLLGLAALAALALVGCSTPTKSAEPAPPVSSVPSTPSSAAAPMFASDEEALAAAEVAYRNYIAVSDQIANDGGAGAERLEPFVSEELYRQQAQEYADVLSQGLRATGASTFDTFNLESYDTESGVIRAYVCIRVSNIRVVDMAGLDVTPSTRNNDLPLQIAFLSGALAGEPIRITQSEVWTGTNFC